MNEPDPFRSGLGAYLADALPAQERAALDAHLAECPACREELARLSPLPRLLGRLSPEDLLADAPAAPADLLERSLAALARARRRERRRLWSRTTGAAILGAAAALAAVLLAVPANSGAPLQLTDAAHSTVTGTVRAASRPWGTEFRVSLRDLPGASSYTLWAVAVDGRRWPAASWGPTKQHRAQLTGAAPVPMRSLARVELQDAQGVDLAVATPAH